MTARKKRKRASPKAGSVPPPSTPRDEHDASVRQLEAEGADRPAARPRPKRAKTAPAAVAAAPLEATVEPPQVPADRPSDAEVVERIRELESRLDRMIGEHAQDRAADDDVRPMARSEPPPSRSAIPPAPDSVLDTARELLSTDFYLRKWGRMGLRNRSEEVDEFGYDPV